MPNKQTHIAKTATQALKILWEEGFFRAWKKAATIVDHLAKRGNNFSAPELGMGVEKGEAVNSPREADQLRIYPKAPIRCRGVSSLPQKEDVNLAQ
jgi:hypothetical protein